jgi:predicted CXXCH cytochrome family protein
MFAVALFVTPAAFATADATHATLTCTECHATKPAAGQPMDFVTGSQASLCGKCHGASSVKATSMAIMSLATPANITNKHGTFGAIPESMKGWMIQWLASKGEPAWGDPSVPWTYGCTSCHLMHSSNPNPYPAFLRYDMTNGELCNFCHGGTVNPVPDWTLMTTRRVLYGPAHLGLLKADGVTEDSVPAFPKDGDVVSSTVNFPLAAFSGIHRSTNDIAYRISIPGSVFNVRDVNPSNHTLWYINADMVTWDTTLEADGPYTVTITPYTPSTLVDANSVTFSVVVQNLTLAEKVGTLADKVRIAGILNQNIANSLISMSTNAYNAAKTENWNAVSGILNAFKYHTEAQRNKSIPSTVADELVAFVNTLLAQITR